MTKVHAIEKLDLLPRERPDGRWELFVPIRGRVHGGDRVHLVGATRDAVVAMLDQELRARIERRGLAPDASPDVVSIPRHLSEYEKTDRVVSELLSQSAQMARRLRAKPAHELPRCENRASELADVPTVTLLRRTGLL